MMTSIQDLSSGTHDNAVSGYITTVSPIKTARKTNTIFFNATIQTSDNEWKNAVCFMPEKHEEFSNYKDEKSPLKITNIEIPRTKKRPGDSDYIINKRSKISLTSLEFQPEESNTSMPITKLVEIGTEIQIHQLINVQAIIQEEQDVETKEIYNKQINMKTCIIADDSASIKLTAWHKHVTIQKGKTYIFSNVRVKMFAEIYQLNTTLETTITEIKNFAGQIIAVQMHTTNQCINCSSNIQLRETEAIIKCEHCFTAQKVSFTKKNKRARVNFSTGKETFVFTMFDNVLTSFLPPEVQTNDDIESHLLSQKTVVAKVNMSKNTIVHLQLEENELG